MNKYRGSGLVDYVIPTAVVGLLLGLGLYYLISNGSILNFTKATANMAVETEKEMGIIGRSSSDPTAVLNCTGGGCFEGTPQNPVKKCYGGYCIIDFGDFVLRNIPDNFGEFAEATGSSGGGDIVYQLLIQLADQLEEAGDPDRADQLRNLANLGHFIADMERQSENIANGCQSDMNPVDCFGEGVSITPLGLDLPANISTLLPDYDSEAMLLNVLTHSRIGNSRNLLLQFPQAFEEQKSLNPSCAYIEILDDIRDDPGFPDSMKGVTTVLSQYIEQLGYTHDFTAYALYHNSGYDGGNTGELLATYNYDIISGDHLGSNNYANNGIDNMAYLLNPDFSGLTDLDSALICAGNGGIDTGNQCF